VKSRTTHTHAAGKSDKLIGARKRRNKGKQLSGDGEKLAEFVEQRGLVKGNTRRAPTAETQRSGKVSRGLSGVREAARRDKSRGSCDAASRIRYRKPDGGCVRFCRGTTSIHPWPNVRFRRRHPRQEPYAVMPHVRICTGGAS
jgi:hypothetical protein